MSQQDNHTNGLIAPTPLRDSEELLVKNGGIWRKDVQGSWYQWRSASELKTPFVNIINYISHPDHGVTFQGTTDRVSPKITR